MPDEMQLSSRETVRTFEVERDAPPAVCASTYPPRDLQKQAYRVCPLQDITVWVKLASRLDRNFKSIRRLAVPADGGALLTAALTSLFPDETHVDIAGARLFQVHTEQAKGHVPLPMEEQIALAGKCFALSTPITCKQDGAFFIVDASRSEFFCVVLPASS